MPGSAACLLSAFLASAVVEAAAGADGEVAAGRAPVQLDGPEENSITLSLVPGAAIRLRSPTNQLSLAYTPRIFYRVPNVLEVSRPLVLHQVSLENAIEVSRQLSWGSSAQLSVGEIDYTASNLVFDPGSSAVRASVVDIVRAEGQTGLRYELSRRLRWTWDLYAEYTTPLGDQTFTVPPSETVEGVPLDQLAFLAGTVPESAQVSTESSLSYAVSRADRLAFNGEVTYQWFPDTGRFLLLSPDISWESQLSRRTQISLSAGVAYVITLETPLGEEVGDALGGTGGFQLGTVLYKARDLNVGLAFGATLDWFFDPVAGTSQPRAGVDVGSDIVIGRDWQITPNAAFYAVLRDATATLGEPDITTPGGTEAPVPTAPQLVTPDATQLRGEIPFRYRLSNHSALTFGLRGSMRGRSITQENFRLDELVEFWAFVGFTLRFSTGNDYGGWLAL